MSITTKTEQAIRDLHDALARLEALGQAPFPVGDPTGTGGPLIAGCWEMGILLRDESLVWMPPAADTPSAPGRWGRWPHAWTRKRDRL